MGHPHHVGQRRERTHRGEGGVDTVLSLFRYGTLFQSVSTTTQLGLHRALGGAFVLLGA